MWNPQSVTISLLLSYIAAPPPSFIAALLLHMLSIAVTVDMAVPYTPPPFIAELEVKESLVTYKVLASKLTPPPVLEAVLFTQDDSIEVTTLISTALTPAPSTAALLSKVQKSRLRVPLVHTPPPADDALFDTQVIFVQFTGTLVREYTPAPSMAMLLSKLLQDISSAPEA